MGKVLVGSAFVILVSTLSFGTGVLATARILGVSDEELTEATREYRQRQLKGMNQKQLKIVDKH